MADTFSTKQRSLCMARVRSHGNKATELKLRDLLRAAKITGWRRKQRLPGKPDFTFRKARLLLFVDGCFWHGCERHFRLPKDNRAYWTSKISRNVARDRETTSSLRRDGWRVLRIWEHDLAGPEKVIRKIRLALRKKRELPTPPSAGKKGRG